MFNSTFECFERNLELTYSNRYARFKLHFNNHRGPVILFAHHRRIGRVVDEEFEEVHLLLIPERV